MKISVITVSYNSERTIADTLRSVATQDHVDMEHIVIDGASTDATLDIVRRDGLHVARVVSERPRHLRRDEQGFGFGNWRGCRFLEFG